MYFGNSLILFLDKFLPEESQTQNNKKSERKLSDFRMNRTNPSEINRVQLTALPAARESGRCFQELFWDGCPSIIWTEQSCCQTSRPKHFSVLSWIPAGFDTINLICSESEQISISWRSHSINWQLPHSASEKKKPKHLESYKKSMHDPLSLEDWDTNRTSSLLQVFRME